MTANKAIRKIDSRVKDRRNILKIRAESLQPASRVSEVIFNLHLKFNYLLSLGEAPRHFQDL
jgi:hypothetical protein